MKRPPYAKIPIPKRKLNFGFEEIESAYFFNDNAILSSFFAAMSVVFPPGEKEFVRSVATFADKIEGPELRKKVTEFSAQESQHRRQHKLANERLDEMGYCATEFEKHFGERIDKDVVKLSDRERLAGTVCAEHITAVLGHALLSNPTVLATMSKPVRDLLFWHAVEELEHKAVAFDVYAETVGDMALLRKALFFQTFVFLKFVTKYQALMLWRMKYRPRVKDGIETWQFFMGRNKGLVGKIRKLYMGFYRKDFHPWDTDDRDLIEWWKSQQGEDYGDASNAKTSPLNELTNSVVASFLVS
jgi:predicted metal-dependent hydrolase